MGNLIRDYEEENDKRNENLNDIVVPTISVPASPPEPQPTGLQLPEASPEAQELLSNPGNELMDMSAQEIGVPDLDLSFMDETPQMDIVEPDYSPFDSNNENDLIIPKGMEEFAQTQETKEQQSFLNQLDTNSLKFLTSGETYPTLYEGGTSFDINNLNNRALGLVNKDFHTARRETNQQLTMPMESKRTDLAKPDFNSGRSIFDSLPGAVKGALNWIGENSATQAEFNPLAGVGAYYNSIKNDPLKLLAAPITAIPMITSQGKFGEQGKGWWGGTMYLLSLPDNIVSGGLTDLHNIITGKKNPKSNTPNIAQAVIAGGNYDFTQPVSPSRPLAFIGSGDKTPKTYDELKKRSGLYQFFSPVIDLTRDVQRSLTGNENINIPDFVFIGPKGKVYRTPAAKAMQVVEAGTGLVADVAKGAVTGLGVGAIDNIFRSGKKAVQVIQNAGSGGALAVRSSAVTKSVTPNTASAAPEVIRIYPKPINTPKVNNALSALPEASALIPDEVVQVIAPAVKVPTPKKYPAVQINIKPNSTIPKESALVPVIKPEMLTPRADVDDIIKEISEAPIGTNVNTEALVTVKRSNEELTKLAIINGDVPPTRTKPLSRARLDELAKKYTDNTNPYKIHGVPLDAEALSQPQKYIDLGDEGVAEIADTADDFPSVEVPLPKKSIDAAAEIDKRWEIINSDVPVEVKQQALSEIDAMYDNILDTPDVSDAGKLAEVSRRLPSSMHTTSNEGRALLQDTLTHETMYSELAAAEQELKPQYINATNTLDEFLKKVEEEPALGRTSALKAEPFEPSPIPDPIDIPLVREDFPNASDQEFDALAQAQSLAKQIDNENLRTVYKSRREELLNRRSDAEIIAEHKRSGSVETENTPPTPTPSTPEIQEDFTLQEKLTAFFLEEGSYTSMDNLKKQFPDVPEEKLSKELQALDEEGAITIEDNEITIDNRSITSSGNLLLNKTKIDESKIPEYLETIDDLAKESNGYFPIGLFREKHPELSKLQTMKLLYGLEATDEIALSSLLEAARYSQDFINKSSFAQGSGIPLFFIQRNPAKKIAEKSNVTTSAEELSKIKIDETKIPKYKEEIENLFNELDNDGQVEIFKFRDKFPELSKQEVEKILYKLEGEGEFDLGGLTEASRYSQKDYDRGSIEQLSSIPLFFMRRTKTKVTKQISDNVYYHGSQVANLDLKNVDPILGGSRNELGVGIYLTKDKNLAINSAKATPNTNLPPLDGREFNEVGDLYEVTSNATNYIKAKEVPPQKAHEAFLQAVKDTQPDEVYRSITKKLGKKAPKKAFSEYFDELDNTVLNKVGNLDEASVLKTQRTVADNLRKLGYEAIDDDDMLVLLHGKYVNNSNLIEKVGNGSLLEGFAARYNVAQTTAARMSKNKALQVQAKEAAAQLQTEITKNVSELYDDAASEAEVAAHKLAQKQDELEEFVRRERSQKTEQKLKASEGQNRRQIKSESQPDNHCY